MLPMLLVCFTNHKSSNSSGLSYCGKGEQQQDLQITKRTAPLNHIDDKKINYYPGKCVAFLCF